ncbi:MAG: type II toxin-antitoxin system VapC family toxin [Acidobacteria bacterium]|nr:type II toxin-antitoxin system VapC family toxin [Acidobacteriota bacterium]
MTYLLDTSICVEVLRGRHPGLIERLSRTEAGEACMSVVVQCELRYGAAKSQHPSREAARLDALESAVPVVALGPQTAAAYGAIRAKLEKRGESIGPLDTLIAAHALALGLILVSDNTREFKRVPGLKVENWLR